MTRKALQIDNEPDATPGVTWDENGVFHSARWVSSAGLPAPRRIVMVNDQTTADAAFRLASEGTGLLWRGDYHNARQLLQAMARRIDRKPPRLRAGETAFNLYRQAQSRRMRTLNMLLMPFEANYQLTASRSPQVTLACEQAHGPLAQACVMPLRDLLGIVGAYEWRRNGVFVQALQDKIHPHFGVFAPVRGEYVDLVAHAPLPPQALEEGGKAFDIGTGTGVLALVLARRGVPKIIATDTNPRAVACANENSRRLNLSSQVEIMQTHLYPPGKADLIVCNPPWLPARPQSALDTAVYDADGRMLQGFLDGAVAHMAPQGEAWLIMSDLAEHLQLRTRDDLFMKFKHAGLEVIDQINTKPTHPRANDKTDLLHAARASETTSLWRLRAGRAL